MTPRQIQILVMAANGFSNQEIGDELGVSFETVKTHVKHLLLKLNARNKAHAVTMGFQRGYLTTTLLEHLSSPSGTSPPT